MPDTTMIEVVGQFADRDKPWAYARRSGADVRGIRQQYFLGLSEGATDVWVQRGTSRYDVDTWIAYVTGETATIVPRKDQV